MKARVEALRPLLKETRSLMVHCDASANYVLRFLLEDVFGSANFRSEIIWRYKRWSNSRRSPIPSHQTLCFYSASDDYKHNQMFGDYSATTNVDQILQSRARDPRERSFTLRWTVWLSALKAACESASNRKVKETLSLNKQWCWANEASNSIFETLKGSIPERCDSLGPSRTITRRALA